MLHFFIDSEDNLIEMDTKKSDTPASSRQAHLCLNHPKQMFAWKYVSMSQSVLGASVWLHLILPVSPGERGFIHPLQCINSD